MNETPSVLIVRTQGWLQATRLTMRLAAHGCRISVICSVDSSIVHAPHVNQRFTFSLANPLGSLRRAIAASKADILVPADDLSVFLLHELSDRTPSLRPLIERSLGARRSYPVLRSRFQLLALAHRLGIAVPETQLIADRDHLQHWSREKAAPFVLKKDGTWGGEGVQIVRNARAADDAYTLLSREPSLTDRAKQWLRTGDKVSFAHLDCLGKPEITAQTLVNGIPANSMYACHRGKILGEVQAQVVASKSRTGASLVVRLINRPEITRAGQVLAEALQLSGFFGLDFVLDARSGEPFLIELNPRATKLGHLAVAGQTDLAGCLWAQLSGQPAPVPADPALGKAISFEPEAQQWTQKSAAFFGCRPDTLAGEEEMLAMLAARKAPLGTRLRETLQSTLARVHRDQGSHPKLEPFYYQDVDKHSLASSETRSTARSRSIRAVG